MRTPLRRIPPLVAGSIGLGVGLLWPDPALACGCFAPPTPAEPVVQAGERIVFAHENGRVVAHIEIQYEGDAEEFAWLVPVPTRPELRLGTEETFAVLDRATTPQFLVQNTGDCGGPSFGMACADDASLAAPSDAIPEGEVRAELATAGPYAYAVIRADAKQPLVDWLNDNRFFVPAEVEDVLDPYIREGAHFLAVKLRSGESVGSLQPIVLEYEADLPMIPIILTSASATPDMGVLVWVLGEHRAIPHNYHQVTLNEEYIDWFGGAANYPNAVARAVDEADGGHGFVTEYAGPSSPMRGALAWPGRFPPRSELEAAAAAATSEADIRSLTRSLGWSAAGVEAVLAQPREHFDAAAIVDALWERYVEPSREAQRLFDDHPYLTRLYTALDPTEMTRDPVFAFNPDLPPVDRLHIAEFDGCEDSGNLTLADGRQYSVDDVGEWSGRDRAGTPRAETIAVMRMEGAPELVVDNRTTLADRADGGGCRTLGRGFGQGLELMLIFLLVGAGRRAFRRG